MVDRFKSLSESFETLSVSNQLELLTDLLKRHVLNHNLHIPDDFLELTVKAMVNLEAKAKVNVIYELAKGLGTSRPNSKESLFPVSRMPFGLLQYIASFFTSSSVDKVCQLGLLHVCIGMRTPNDLQVVCPEDYEQWLVSMYSLFGTKFSKMLRGPMWSKESTCQGSRSSSGILDLLSW